MRSSTSASLAHPEVGAAHILDRDMIALFVEGTLNVLKHYGVVQRVDWPDCGGRRRARRQCRVSDHSHARRPRRISREARRRGRIRPDDRRAAQYVRRGGRGIRLRRERENGRLSQRRVVGARKRVGVHHVHPAGTGPSTWRARRHRKLVSRVTALPGATRPSRRPSLLKQKYGATKRRHGHGDVDPLVKIANTGDIGGHSEAASGEWRSHEIHTPACLGSQQDPRLPQRRLKREDLMRKLQTGLLGVVVLSAVLASAATPAFALGGCGPNGHRNWYGRCVFGGQNQDWCLSDIRAIQPFALPMERCAVITEALAFGAAQRAGSRPHPAGRDDGLGRPQPLIGRAWPLSSRRRQIARPSPRCRGAS